MHFMRRPYGLEKESSNYFNEECILFASKTFAHKGY